MSVFFKISPKERVQSLNDVFITHGENELFKNGFKKMIYQESFNGKNNLGGFSYNYYRLTQKSELEYLTVHISKSDKWVKIFLNIFKLNPHVSDLNQLNGLKGNQFAVPPNSVFDLRLRLDEYKVPALIYLFFCPIHKLGMYFTKWGFKRELKKLANLLHNDMANIDNFVKIWHQIYKPLNTNWEGEIIGLEKMTPQERLIAANLEDMFNKARNGNKQWARQILQWLKIDNENINKMLDA